MFEHGFPKHWTTLKKLIWLVGSGIAGGAKGIWKTVTGTLIHITDALASPMQKCEITLDPIQDLHGQDAPYPAGGWVNQLDMSLLSSSGTTYGLTATVSGDVVTVSGTYNNSNAAPSFRILWYKIGGSYAKMPFSLKAFPADDDTAATHVGSLGKADGNHTITVNLKNMVQDTEYSITFKIVGYYGTAPTSWSPFANICPITGWTGAEVTRTGKNLLEPKFYSGVIYNPSVGQSAFTTLIDITNTVTKEGNTYSKTGSSWEIAMNMVLPLSDALVGKTLKFSGTINAISGFRCAWLITDAEHITKRKASSMNELPNWSVTIEEGDAYLIWYMNSSSGGTFTLTEPQVELGSTATTYEPYSGTTLSVTFPDGQTVYGGTVDLVSGVLTVDMASVDLSTLTWYYGSLGSGPYFYTLANADMKPPANNNTKANIMCSLFKCVAANDLYTRPTDTGIISLNTQKSIQVRDNRYSDAAEFKTAMSGVQFVYELAEPAEIQLTP